jgi:hypothetical protein
MPEAAARFKSKWSHALSAAGALPYIRSRLFNS